MAGPPSAKPAAPKLKLKFGSFSTSATNSPTTAITPSAESSTFAKKQTKKSQAHDAADGAGTPIKITTSKKRPLEDVNTSSAKKAKPNFKIKLGGSGSTAGTGSVTAMSRPQMIKLRTKSQILKIKSKAPLGAPPRRDPGHGYDSEADDIEIDPAIENQFVIRMIPGEDCDYLRQAINDRLIGTKDHAKDVSLHFFDRDGRRAAVSIRGNLYAATLVDLPCIVETHKSWDKKNFFKVADVHQMLLVHKRIKNQDEARNAEIPDIVDKTNYQFPHGLTPPLFNVRKRRFRKRVSNRTIEAVEEEVDRLLRLDAEAMETSAEVVQPNAREDEEDAEGEEDDGIVQDSIEDEPGAEGSDDDEDAFERLFAQVLADERGNDNNDAQAPAAPSDGPDAILSGTEIQASPDAMQVTTETPEAQQQITPATPAGGPSATEEESADEEEDEDSDDDNDDSELDEEEKARLEEEAQLKEEVDDIKKELSTVEAQLKGLSNKILRQRLEDKKNKLKRDLQLKMANLGRTMEDDEDDE